MKPVIKKGLKSRLNRIEGQVRGVQKMVDEEKYCIDIITQAQAIKSAVSAFESLMLKNHLETHVIHQMKHGKGEKAINEILKVYNVSQKKK
ncbi:MAG: metal-sensitive transcriptional regulator [Parcubacteria group bacterium]